MNILPKKRWHVRTKDNIARVRRDEAAAKEEEQKRQEKLILAESEARINFLRKKSGSTTTEGFTTENKPSTPSGSNIVNQHVDLFSDYKSHIKKTNKALEDEKKQEQEKYEKQIGYLTYLGQDTNEALKLRSWYEIAPKRTEVGDSDIIEKDVKNKQSQDPLTLINALLPKVEQKKVVTDFKQRSREDTSPPSKNIKKLESITEKYTYTKHKKSKKHKKHKHKKEKLKDRKRSKYEDNEGDMEEIQRIKREKLEKMRKERLIREANERARQEALLAPIKPVQEFDNTNSMPHQRIVQKYNSQFNPEIAKQNMI
ncbi:leukocyte receptor cluster member 1 homolog [Bactrocera neohumeralis]|uniref:leukocyte receptor cluster member 1 homolog n=1 Tax=Bactrocera tryoni TaxID=59916 RepID=UPI001A978753|nr:leukocyte receptor cluster member 1 homolog [Bactrocera tryoni]XP_050318161.1 leukocyte receptor cluster member 1 homolog [Bactrocera neohumeralis]